MRAFDFDGTLYSGDSTIDFWMFCVKNQRSCLKALPHQLVGGTRFVLGKLPRDDFKQAFYAFLPIVDNVEDAVNAFWATSKTQSRWIEGVVKRARPGDIVVSASPEFLLRKVCNDMELKLIASKVDPQTGHLIGPNCRGSEKVRRVKEAEAELEIELPFSEFYTDSLVDSPMASMSKRAFLVKRGRIEPFEVKA